MTKTLVQKLFMKAGYGVGIVKAPDGFVLADLPEDVAVAGDLNGRYDWLLLFVKNKGELDKYGVMAITAVKPNGLLWIAYPKRSGSIKTDITRDHGWDVMAEANWRPVTQVAIDETWSALRWRPKKPEEMAGNKE